MKVEQLYRQYGIQIAGPSAKHYRPNWINTSCPFCTGNPGHHLGFNLETNSYTCWRCGFHSKEKVISTLLHINEFEAKRIIKDFGGSSSAHKKPVQVKIGTSKLLLPPTSSILAPHHRKYLTGRNFKPSTLVKEWHLLGTGPSARMDTVDYKNRIIAPIYWDDKLVSFQTRAISSKAQMKYITCPKTREVIHHKHILYGNQSKWTDLGICVEGITDVWRLGSKSFATFGIKYKREQVRQMSKHFKRVAVAFDFEPQAQEMADKLVADLQFRGVEAFKVHIENDPGSMSDEEAAALIREIQTYKIK